MVVSHRTLLIQPAMGENSTTIRNSPDMYIQLTRYKFGTHHRYLRCVRDSSPYTVGALTSWSETSADPHLSLFICLKGLGLPLLPQHWPETWPLSHGYRRGWPTQSSPSLPLFCNSCRHYPGASSPSMILLAISLIVLAAALEQAWKFWAALRAIRYVSSPIRCGEGAHGCAAIIRVFVHYSSIMAFLRCCSGDQFAALRLVRTVPGWKSTQSSSIMEWT